MIAALFFLSGLAALIYQVLWQRELALLFGNTAEATAATLIVFFLGLALGSRVLGRRSARWRRPLRAFALLEAGGALAALLVLALLPLYRGAFPSLYAAVGDAPALFLLAKTVLSGVLVLPASFLMGGTLPALQEWAVRRGARFGPSGSLLYAMNTLGAAAGAAAAGFLLPAALGYRGSYAAAVALSLAVGAGAWWASRGPQAAPAPAGPTPEDAAPRPGAFVVVVAALSGFAALALEVLCTRLFALGLQNSVHTFAAVLVVFLLALGLGALIASALARRRFDPDRVLGLLLLCAALGVAAVPRLFLWFSPGPDGLGAQLEFGPYLREVFGLLFAVLFVPATAVGCVFPYLLRVESARRGRDGGSAGPRIGRLVAWNTVGALAGAWVAGFLMPRILPLWMALPLVAAAYVPLWPLTARPGTGRHVRMAVCALLCALLLQYAYASSQRGEDWLARTGERVVALYEGSSGTVAVVDRRGDLKLRLGTSYTLGGSADPRWEEYQAHIPLALHPEPKEVFFLGLGTGITAGAALSHPVDRVTVAELVPEAVRASREHFGPWTNGLFEDPRARIVLEDGRTVLRGSPAAYDVVVGDLFLPWKRGTGLLYTREQFEAARESLRDGGLFAQWLPLFQLSAEEFGGIARTFAEVFPSATLWRGDFFARRPIVALVGQRGDRPLDPARAVACFARLDETGAVSFGPASASLPFLLYAGNLGARHALLSGYRPVTDDRPWIELEAPRSQRARAAKEEAAFAGAALAAFEREVLGDPAEDPFLRDLSDRQRRMTIGGLALYRYAVHDRYGTAAQRRRALADFLLRVPATMRPEFEDWIR